MAASSGDDGTAAPALPAALAFRFRPPLALFARLVAAFGLGLGLAVPLFGLEGASRTFALACAVCGPMLAALYLLSPAWRLAVVVEEAALVVRRGADVRLRLPWTEVREVVASPSTRTCFVDGGSATNSLLVPGPGAPGPYRLERREALYDAILARVPAERVRTVDRLAASRPRA